MFVQSKTSMAKLLTKKEQFGAQTSTHSRSSQEVEEYQKYILKGKKVKRKRAQKKKKNKRGNEKKRTKTKNKKNPECLKTKI